MRNVQAWTPNKFEKATDGRWCASRSEVPVSSRIFIDLVAIAYAKAIETHAFGRLADLGCGKVPLYAMYRDQVSEVVCIDWLSSLHESVHVDEFMDLNTSVNLEPERYDTVMQPM
jgi:hypothetical protein